MDRAPSRHRAEDRGMEVTEYAIETWESWRKGMGVRNSSAELELKQHTMDDSTHPEYGMEVSG